MESQNTDLKFEMEDLECQLKIMMTREKNDDHATKRVVINECNEFRINCYHRFKVKKISLIL